MTDEDQIFGYDDLELYTRVKLDGREGWILDKGPHVVGEVEEHEHVYIEYTNSKKGQDAFRRIHQNLVDEYLRKRKKLWVDWDDRLYGDDEPPTDAINQHPR